MGLFGSLIGWDQIMGATNAVMASHLIQELIVVTDENWQRSCLLLP